MDELGYDVEWQVLNSKHFGVHQNRERVFIVGHLREAGGRKVFPIGCGDEVPDKKRLETEPSFPALTATDYKGVSKQRGGLAIPVMTPGRPNKRQNGRRFKENGDEMFTLTAADVQGVMVREATSKGYAIACEGDAINLAMPKSKTRRGRVGKGVAQTLDTSCNQGTLVGTRIRRLTPRECFRLQGFPDEYFDRAAAVNSDSQLYKQAGNGVTVNVIYEIARRLEV